MSTYALFAVASYYDEVVEERVVRRGGRLRIGGPGGVPVPVPEGSEFLALITFDGTTGSVRDSAGGEHSVTATAPMELSVGPVKVHLHLAEQFPVKRTEPPSLRMSLAWMTIVMMATVTSMKAEWAIEHRCEIAGVTVGVENAITMFPECAPRTAAQSESVQFTAEYLARLLKEDYAGDEKGVIEREIDREDAVKETPSFYLPAGDEGPVTDMGGAEELAPEPVRSVEEDEVIPIPEKLEEQNEPEPLLTADDNEETKVEPKLVEKPEEKTTDGIADAMDLDEEPVEEEEAVVPAEEKEGWGVRDWYDEKDQLQDNLEIEAMLRAAKNRLAIDPDDPSALSILSYYQYLAQDYEAAIATYDRFIDLYPEDASGYNNKALVYKRQGDYRKEEALYRVALSIEPLDVTAMNNLGVNLAHQGRFEEAQAVMEQLEALDPNDPYADLHRAKIHAEMGNHDQCFVYLERALTGMAKLDTLHHIEFRQDIRVDPSFDNVRDTHRFRAILDQFYGEDSPLQD